jgi:hypothetical protein
MNYAAEASQIEFSDMPRAQNRFVRAWEETKSDYQAFKRDFEHEEALLMVSMVAKLIGVHRSRIHQLLSEGKLTKFEHFDLIYVSKREVLAWLYSERDKGGRPSKAA